MSPEINIGENVARLRKAAGVTQEELAGRLGVTKASVSKWETGQSLPDVAMLPKVAAYFDVTVDELIGYEPQLSREQIRATCAGLRVSFSRGPFDEAREALRTLSREYWSCYPLFVQLAQLCVNHADVASDAAARQALLDDAAELCARVRERSHVASDVRLASAVEAIVAIWSGDPGCAVELLAPVPAPYAGEAEVLAGAYHMRGEAALAEQTLQAELYQGVIASVSALSALAQGYVGDAARLDALYGRLRKLVDAFDLERVWPSAPTLRLSFAACYASGGDEEKALGCLEDYERAVRRMTWPARMGGDEFFDALDGWLDKAIASGADAPRDEAVVKRMLLEGVTKNPAFAQLAGSSRFERVVESLKDDLR